MPGVEEPKRFYHRPRQYASSNQQTVCVETNAQELARLSADDYPEHDPKLRIFPDQAASEVRLTDTESALVVARATVQTPHTQRSTRHSGTRQGCIEQVGVEDTYHTSKNCRQLRIGGLGDLSTSHRTGGRELFGVHEPISGRGH